MQETQLESYLCSLKSQLKSFSPAEREAEIREVRQHLEALIAWHLQQGQNSAEATRLAICQFGRAERLGRDLNIGKQQNRFETSIRWVGQGFLIWCGLWLAELLFFSSMNNKPTDVPYYLSDRVLWAAVLATAALFCGHFYDKAMKKRKASRVCA